MGFFFFSFLFFLISWYPFLSSYFFFFFARKDKNDATSHNSLTALEKEHANNFNFKDTIKKNAPSI